MRSTDTSGASATGLSAGKGRPSRDSAARKSLFSAQTLSLSPIASAVAITSFLAAFVFIIHDTARTFAEARRDVAGLTATLAAELGRLGPQAGPISLRAEDLVLAESVSNGDNSVYTIETLTPSPLPGIFGRGGVALGLAGLLSAFAWRRYRNDGPQAQQRANYRTLAAAIPMGIACWTRTGELVVCNDKYRESLQLSGATVSYHEAVRQLVLGGYMKLLKEDEHNRLLEVHREDGSCMLIDERPLADGGFMTLISDVTEAKRTDTLLNAIREEQRLLARRYHEEKIKAEAASRSKTNFLAHLSHDIRTPLNHIIGFADLMRHQTYGPLGDQRYDDYVASIKQSGEHLLASFATILDLAELESGQKALRNDPVSVDDLLDGAVQRYRAQAARAGVTFVLGEASAAIVVGDKLGLTRMIGNIVENSLRFTPHGGRVTLASFAARDGVVIEITDTGIGMSEERLASLSQPFALGDATFTREGVGPGLGISISRAIAELSGGNMAIDSSPSLGTTVAISLPLRLEASLIAAE